MIIVTGGIVATPEGFEAARRIGMEHSVRSRAEPGCLSHDLHVDCENPLKLVFVERWADAEALKLHFRVPASIDFVRAIRKLAAEASRMEVYAAEPTRITG
jgi:quinol monooxygenase YgiN